MFIYITAIIAFALAVVSEAFSITGMAATFPSIFWSVVAMGAVLGAGKLAAASFLYRYWDYAPKLLSVPMVVFVVVLTTISITGHFGYLSKGYMQDSIPLKQIETQIAQLEKERDRKVERKKEIDTQVANLPSDRAAARVRLMKQFSDEQTVVTNRINALDAEITTLKSRQIETSSHVGPIMYISQALGITTDDGVKWFILLIVSVFDPLALALTIAVSVMIKHRLELLESQQEEVEEEHPRVRRRKVREKDIPLDLFELAEDVDVDADSKGGTVYSKSHQPADSKVDLKIKHPFKD